ncbi:MAG: Tic22 family protein [Elainellaceae cyanobacterium]
MKSLIRKGATLLTAGTLAIGSVFAAGLEAIALTSEQIVQQLSNVPVFTITDESGSPLVSEVSRGEEEASPVTQVFINQEDAQEFIEGIRGSSPDLANSVQVTPVSLARIYEVALMGQNPDTRLEFIFVPDRDQVQSAVMIEQDTVTDESVDEFAGVPLFTARSGVGGDDVGYLTIQRGEQEVIPVFFSEADLTSLLSEIETSQPDLAGTLSPHVIRLEDLIYTLETTDDEQLTQIRLIPASETLRFIQQQQQQQQ